VSNEATTTTHRKLERGESIENRLRAKASEFLSPEFKTAEAAKPDAATDPLGAAVDALAARQPERHQPRNVEESVRLAFRETPKPAVDLSDLTDEELSERADALNAEADRRELAAWEAMYGSLDEPLAETEADDELDLDPEVIALQDASE
jgi:hypothetical protein